jgi:ABC-type amino acid transport substrate-binding protein
LDGQSLLVREESGISSVAGLDGKIVAAIQGSTSIENIRAQAEKEGIQI